MVVMLPSKGLGLVFSQEPDRRLQQCDVVIGDTEKAIAPITQQRPNLAAAVAVVNDHPVGLLMTDRAPLCRFGKESVVVLGIDAVQAPTSTRSLPVDHAGLALRLTSVEVLRIGVEAVEWFGHTTGSASLLGGVGVARGAE